MYVHERKYNILDESINKLVNDYTKPASSSKPPPLSACKAFISWGSVGCFELESASQVLVAPRIFPEILVFMVPTVKDDWPQAYAVKVDGDPNIAVQIGFIMRLDFETLLFDIASH